MTLVVLELPRSCISISTYFYRYFSTPYAYVYLYTFPIIVGDKVLKYITMKP